MSQSILHVLKDAFTDKAIQAISGNLGEDVEKTKSGLSAMLPTILGGILGKNANATTAPNWWNSVANLFGGDDDDDLKLGLIGDPKLAEAGKGLLGNLFGGNLDSILGSLAGATALGKEKSGKLLTTVAPMVIGFLSRWTKKKGLSFGGLISKLTEDKSEILGALPAGLGSGMLGLVDKPKEVYKETTRKVEEVKTAKPKFNWSWLLLLLGLLILLWLLFGRGCNRSRDDIEEQATEVVTDIDQTATDVAQSIKGSLNDAGDWIYDLGATIKKRLLDGNEMEIGVNSVEFKLLEFIEDTSLPIDKTTWFTLDRLFFETGSSTFKPESQDQLDRIAAIMKAYPSVTLKLGGYTDNTGSYDLNMALSSERAEAAKAQLINRGIAANRLEAEGYGPEHPVCPANDTPECRARNRRIDVRVTAK
ncbi:MAG: OmpA family protein [Bacteroidales bacterium]|jgi:outer membrane protein OmpA-like peptidoglycan-associated protein|nr:OmpA family protein [Bacteroidales bacterium]NLM93775.1 OmpA family protein [Bacteroidales bacterium]